VGDVPKFHVPAPHFKVSQTFPGPAARRKGAQMPGKGGRKTTPAERKSEKV
jgi:hypothetical protein